jgi:hypothetical protein
VCVICQNIPALLAGGSALGLAARRMRMRLRGEEPSDDSDAWAAAAGGRVAAQASAPPAGEG